MTKIHKPKKITKIIQKMIKIPLETYNDQNIFGTSKMTNIHLKTSKMTRITPKPQKNNQNTPRTL